MTTIGLCSAIERQGFAVLPRLLDPERVASLVSDLDGTLAGASASVLQSRGQVYGVRNLVDLWPAALIVAQDPGLTEILNAMLGHGFGLVRSIFFDKPPGRTWSLPWHRDMTIAVRETKGAAGGFGRSTVKAGVPHVEAPSSLLRGMLTARVALDDVTDGNGPLLVIPGSHQDARINALPSEDVLAGDARPVHMIAGDVLLIRPLVVHRSGSSKSNTIRHRRTLHFEFAPSVTLPGGLKWHQFLRTQG